jgi:hypothetical protein
MYLCGTALLKPAARHADISFVMSPKQLEAVHAEIQAPMPESQVQGDSGHR